MRTYNSPLTAAQKQANRRRLGAMREIISEVTAEDATAAGAAAVDDQIVRGSVREFGKQLDPVGGHLAVEDAEIR